MIETKIEEVIMRVKSLMLVVVFTMVGLLFAGCNCMQQAVKGEAPPPQPAEALVQPEPAPAPPPPPEPAPAPAAAPAAVPAVAVLSPIYFDFDKYNIRPGDDEILKGHLKWFQENSGKALKIEGNCDERGTVEYNMVLGQKRADAAKARLGNLGVDKGRLQTISYGKDKPFCTDHDEACWAKNRRADIKPVE